MTAEEKAKKKRKPKTKEADDGTAKEEKPKKAKKKDVESELTPTGRKKKVVTVKRLLLNDAVAHAGSMDGSYHVHRPFLLCREPVSCASVSVFSHV